MSFRIKVCGITDAAGLDVAVAAGAEAVGFNFHLDSPRQVTPATARALVARLPAGVAAVGVFVNQPLDQVRKVMDVSGVGWAQMHGDERASDLAGFERPWYPVVRPGPGETRLEEDWEAPFILVDARSRRAYGGTGRAADWGAAARLARRRRVVLAGGLSPDNRAAALEAVRHWGVDLNSGVESAPGIKDPDRLARAMAILRPWRRAALEVLP